MRESYWRNCLYLDAWKSWKDRWGTLPGMLTRRNSWNSCYYLKTLSGCRVWDDQPLWRWIYHYHHVKLHHEWSPQKVATTQTVVYQDEISLQHEYKDTETISFCHSGEVNVQSSTHYEVDMVDIRAADIVCGKFLPCRIFITDFLVRVPINPRELTNCRRVCASMSCRGVFLSFQQNNFSFTN